MDQRVRSERARKAWAVLMVAGIGVGSLAVHVWPRSAPRVASIPVIHARPLFLFDVPHRLAAGTLDVPVVPPVSASTRRTAGLAGAPEQAQAGEPVASLQDVPSPSGPVHHAAPAQALLASRMGPAALGVPVLTRPTAFPADDAAIGQVPAGALPATITGGSPLTALAEIPATAVGRVFTSAGKGIVIGVRLTGSAMRAAF